MADTSIQQTVHEVLAQVLRDAGREVPPIDGDATLGETLKLDSLDLAVVVVQLESRLGVDPFRQQAQPVRTVGDLVTVYESAVRA